MLHWAIHRAYPEVAAVGEPQQWPEAMTEGLRNTLGSADFCWLAFQSLWDELLAADTDFLH